MSNLSNYDEFQLKEFDKISDAFFNTVNSISSFFRYYILLISLPIPLLLIFFQDSSSTSTSLIDSIKNILKDNLSFSIIFILVFPFIGIGVLGYLVNLRCDALLYAKAVNGVRSYFFNETEANINNNSRYSALPKSVFFPKYLEKSYFGFVIGVFSIIDSFYLLLGLILLYKIHYHSSLPTYIILTILIAFISLHIILYYLLTRYRSSSYLRKQIIGIDIDGVLNKHEEKFCLILRETTGKKLDPRNIISLPVSEDNKCGINDLDEKQVFNEPKYWKEMPSDDHAVKIIEKLKDAFNYKIDIFTYRPWPNLSYFNEGERKNIKNKWKKKFLRLIPYTESINKITKEWLNGHKYKYNKLYIEKGDAKSPSNSTFKRNRFKIAIRKTIKIFVEDDLNKAIKLAAICEYVFLIEHRYNSNTKTMGSGKSAYCDILHGEKKRPDEPKNLIRVRDWNEIYKFIRDYL